MGGKLTTHVVDLATLGRLKGLSDRALILLLGMASVARDQDQRNVDRAIYFGGWEYLAKLLLFPSYTRAAHTAVARAIRELVDAGLVEPLNLPGPRRRQAYRLTLPEPLA